MSNERIERLEERIAWLERHLGEQDRVILGLTESMDRVKAELARMRMRVAAMPVDPGNEPEDDKPPHY